MTIRTNTHCQTYSNSTCQCPRVSGVVCWHMGRGWTGKKPSICVNTGYPAFCLWPTVITGIPVATVKKMSRKILFLYIFIWKVKVTLWNKFRELQIFRLFSCQISGTGSAGTGIWNTGTGYPVPAQILGSCSAQPLHSSLFTHYCFYLALALQPRLSGRERNNPRSGQHLKRTLFIHHGIAFKRLN